MSSLEPLGRAGATTTSALFDLGLELELDLDMDLDLDLDSVVIGKDLIIEEITRVVILIII